MTEAEILALCPSVQARIARLLRRSFLAPIFQSILAFASAKTSDEPVKHLLLCVYLSIMARSRRAADDSARAS